MYLGIDLGTSNSAVVGNDKGVLRLFKTSDGRDVLPSAIYIDRRGNKFVGARARDQASLSPENVAQGFKRLMGTSTPFRFAGSNIELTPEEASAEILRSLLAQARGEVGDITIEGVVITTPAAFNQMQSEATIRSAHAAGLSSVGLLQEPVAAALASLEVSTNKDGIFLVYDLGGGTFDVALVQSTRGAATILAHEGVNMLGGRDFDRTIVNSIVRPWLMETYDLPADFQKDASYQRLMKLAAMKAEEAKIELSSRDSAQIFVPEEEARTEDAAGREIFVDISIDRLRLEELTRDPIDATIELCRKILSAHGLSHDDVDRLVFIGGPSKMPAIRDRVPRELGIAADLKTDPMTAVARGAAIFAESRDWEGVGSSTRKSARGSKITKGPIEVSYDYETRTSDDVARIRATLRNPVPGLSIAASNEVMWQSGAMPLGSKETLKVPLPRLGENKIRIIVTDDTGRVAEEACADLVITRISASAAGIPAPQTIAVKTRRGEGQLATNQLEPLFRKGDTLPASGRKPFRASHGVRGGSTDILDIEIFQQTPDVPEPELNLFIGAYRVMGSQLDDDVVIQKGDEVIVHWRVDDNMLLSCALELPAQGLKLDDERFYSPSLGHKNFDGEAGQHLAANAVDEAAADIDGLAIALAGSASGEIAELRRKVERQRQELARANEPDTCRAIDEEARHLRQEVSRLKHASEHRAKVLSADIDRATDLFAELVADADPDAMQRIKQLITTAEESLKRDDLVTAERAVEDLRTLVFAHIRRQPAYVLAAFQRAADERFLAIDPVLHDEIVNRGNRAIERDDLDGVREATWALYQNRAETDSPSNDLASLAGLMSH